VAYRYPAIVAGVGALVLVVVILILSGWVRWVRGRLIHVNLLVRLAGSGLLLGGHSAGPFLCPRPMLPPH
jgi:hypothetical protein